MPHLVKAYCVTDQDPEAKEMNDFALVELLVQREARE